MSTVANIDWPSRRDLSSEKQQAEIVQILETATQLKLNALILQVRPSGDAIYPSNLEPWSEFLTGEQGRAPNPYYDPLQFWIEQAHKRGIQLHAWFNPYRARTPSMRTVCRYAYRQTRAASGAHLWRPAMDGPAEPIAAQHTLAVIRDVVQRYDIDGVHIDDYFIPTRSKIAPASKSIFLIPMHGVPINRAVAHYHAPIGAASSQSFG